MKKKKKKQYKIPTVNCYHCGIEFPEDQWDRVKSCTRKFIRYFCAKCAGKNKHMAIILMLVTLLASCKDKPKTFYYPHSPNTHKAFKLFTQQRILFTY